MCGKWGEDAPIGISVGVGGGGGGGGGYACDRVFKGVLGNSLGLRVRFEGDPTVVELRQGDPWLPSALTKEIRHGYVDL